MRYPTLFSSLVALASSLPAQCPANSTFTTLWASTTTIGSPDPVVGSNMFFDLATNVRVTICEIDVNLLDANQVGQTTQLVFWTAPSTYVNNHINPGAWTQLGTGTMTVAASGQPSRAVFSPPITLPPGTWGVALQHMPVTTGPAPGPLHPLYTNPARATPPPPLVYSDTHITLTAGAGQTTAFASGLATPRIINTNIHYTPDPRSATFSSFGTGCNSPGELTLTPDARPVLGQGINLVTDNIPVATTPVGFVLLGFNRLTPGMDLTAVGMPGCFLHIVSDASALISVTGPSMRTPLGIPNNPSLISGMVYAQSLTMTTGANAAGVLSSNGVALRLGN